MVPSHLHPSVLIALERGIRLPKPGGALAIQVMCFESLYSGKKLVLSVFTRLKIRFGSLMSTKYHLIPYSGIITNIEFALLVSNLNLLIPLSLISCQGIKQHLIQSTATPKAPPPLCAERSGRKLYAPRLPTLFRKRTSPDCNEIKVFF
jgi:hypothetical protein